MKKTIYIFFFLLLGVAVSCQKESAPEHPTLTISSSVVPFENENGTKVNLDGDAFENGDWIRLKLICPFVTDMQNGENPSSSYDGFWLLQRSGGGWIILPASAGCDVNGDRGVSGGPNLYGVYLSQATPYVFTASTWSEEVGYLAGSYICEYRNVFHADQSRLKEYKNSNVLWAQQIRETGSWNVHLSFYHVMSSAIVTIDTNGETFDLSKAVLTIEGVPDIDEQEIIVGDYYAAKSKANAVNGYKQKNACTVENNGKVIGIGHIGASGATCLPMDGTAVPNTGVYRAYQDLSLAADGSVFRFILPPVDLGAAPVLWVRSGDKRYKATFSRSSFEAGKCYNFTMKLTH